MSRTGSIIREATIDQSVYLGFGLIVTCAVLGRLFYLLPFTTKAQTRRIFFTPWCWLYGHEWADERKYGVGPECLTCTRRREVSES